MIVCYTPRWTPPAACYARWVGSRVPLAPRAGGRPRRSSHCSRAAAFTAPWAAQFMCIARCRPCRPAPPDHAATSLDAPDAASPRPTNRTFVGGARSQIGECGVLLRHQPRRSQLVCTRSPLSSAQPFTQQSTWTSLRAWSLAAHQRQYHAPQPLQRVSASLCAAEACGRRVRLCTAQLYVCTCLVW